MAHSDVLIFLTNITWIFSLFLIVYFSFVLFFLPSFYKHMRIRHFFKFYSSFVKLVLTYDLVGDFAYVLSYWTVILESSSFFLNRVASLLRGFSNTFLTLYFSNFNLLRVAGTAKISVISARYLTKRKLLEHIRL